MNTPIIALALLLALVACGSDNGSDSSPSPFEGTWTGECLESASTNGDYLKDAVVIEGNTSRSSTTYFSKAGCKNASRVTRHVYIESFKAEMREDGLYKTSGVGTDYFITIYNEQALEAQQESETCGDNWELEEERSVAECYPDWIGTFYNLAKIDGDKLFFGIASETKEGRPEKTDGANPLVKN